MSIQSVIDRVRKRPGMYLGSKNLTALSHMLGGYKLAESDMGIYQKAELFPLDFRYMQEFTKVRLKCNDNLGWWNHILNFCDGDEEMALDKFFELYDEFIAIRAKKCWKAILTEGNIQWNNSMERTYLIRGNNQEKEPSFTAPVAVYIIELTIPVYLLVVETKKDIRLEHQFHVSFEAAKGDGCIPAGAECYFGKIDSWEEILDKEVVFDKDIVFG